MHSLPLIDYQSVSTEINIHTHGSPNGGSPVGGSPIGGSPNGGGPSLLGNTHQYMVVLDRRKNETLF